MKYLPVIGLEIHTQLKTRSKMFCGCSNRGEFEPPNTTLCPICLGHPGTLPVINKQAVEWTLVTALALGSEIPELSKFDRKNYFYPDLPKGYQISQYDKPLAVNGFLEIEGTKIRIRRAHLEEDTGKLLHPEGADYSLVDFNRAGTPLMELVTEPDLRSARAAKKFCQELQLILRYLEVSDADMEKGQMRCEVNISLAPEGSEAMGTKVEIKNLNSFRSVERSIEYEIKRQSKLLAEGKKISQETRGWHEAQGVTILQRVKEEAHDYRYFPEPDLPPLKFDQKWLDELKLKIPELPQDKRQRFISQLGFKPEQATILTTDKNLADYTEQVISELKAWLSLLESVEGDEEEIWRKSQKKIMKLVSGWLTSRLLKLLNEHHQTIKDCQITPENFAELIAKVYENKISSTNAQVILKEMYKTGADACHILEEKNLNQVSDEGEIKKSVQKVIQENPEEVKKYLAGKKTVLMFLVGQVMRQMRGKANPQLVRKMLEEKLR